MNSMKKYILFYLIIFLVLIIQFNLVSASATRCHIYVDGICTTWYYYASEAEAPPSAPAEVPFQQTQILSQQIISQFITLVFQFFGMVLLFILLIILLQSLVES